MDEQTEGQELQSLLDMHLDEMEDPTTVPGGEEYQLKISSAKLKPSKTSERTVLEVVFDIIDHESAIPIFENMAFALKDDEKKTSYSLRQNIRSFMQAFSIDLGNPGDPSEWKGLEGWAFVKMDEFQGQPCNRVSRYIKRK